MSKNQIETYKVGENIKFKNNIKYRGYDKVFIFNVFSNDMYIRPALQQGFLFEKKLTVALYNLLPKNGIVVDVGANLGIVCIPLGKRASQIFAFEPQSEVFNKLLVPNIIINNMSNIIKPLLLAVGHYNGDVNMSMIADNSLVEYNGDKIINYGAVKLGIDGEKVKMITLDSLKLKQLDILKVDVEGAEPLVFYGARETIKRCKPVIAFEHNYQQLSTDSHEALHLTDKILSFDIVKFAERNKYKIIIEINADNFILVPPHITLNTHDSKFKCIKVNKISKYNNTTLDKYLMLKIKW